MRREGGNERGRNIYDEDEEAGNVEDNLITVYVCAH